MSDKTDGAAKAIRGSIKEALGMVLGDNSVEAEGAAEKIDGRMQSADAAARRPRGPGRQ